MSRLNAAMSEVLLGIDMGTSSSKAVVANVDGQILASATRPRPNSMSMPRPGWAEVDAESVWWGDVVSLCQELVGRIAGHTIVAVCVSGVGPSLLLCGEVDRLDGGWPVAVIERQGIRERVPVKVPAGQRQDQRIAFHGLR